ncbi:MAG: ABC transporter permease, partial [Anaerolineae bacterium]|nr:ABC transporter permease [Anaerolineae bacterium]
MDSSFLVQTLASVVAASTPVVLASIGETISEKSGVTNLSLDGSIALSAMTGFAVAFVTGSVWLGIGAAMLVGALVASIIAFASITLGLEQV